MKMRLLITSLAVCSLFLLAAAPAGPNLWQQTAQSTDVKWLESVATMSDSEPTPWLNQGAKVMRGRAYARLGTLGTAESLAAVERIESAAKAWRPNAPHLTEGTLPHPGWHMGDSEFRPDLRAETGGVTYALFFSFQFGSFDLLLTSTRTPQDKASWSAPHIVPLRIYRGMRDLALSPGAAKGTLLLSYVQDAPPPRGIMEGTPDRGPLAPKLGEQKVLIDVAAVLEDSDGDGLTDAEEQRLGIDPHRRDTDGDRIEDGEDPAPDFPTPSRESLESQLLKKAFFAAFGISRSRVVMFVDPDRSPKIQPWGTQMQVVYGGHPGEGATRGGWRLKSSTGGSAIVELWDAEGPLAGGTMEVRLEKKSSRWYVVSVEMTTIS